MSGTDLTASGRMTNPVFSFGVKKVDLGGISRPSRAVRSISATLTGRISTAAAGPPRIDLGQGLVQPVLVGHVQRHIGERGLQPGPVQGAYAVEPAGLRVQPPGPVGTDQDQEPVRLHGRQGLLARRVERRSG